MKKGKRSLPVYLEIADVAKRLKIDEDGVRHMIKTKRIKPIAETYGKIQLFGSADIELIALEFEQLDRDLKRFGATEEIDDGEDNIDFDGNIG